MHSVAFNQEHFNLPFKNFLPEQHSWKNLDFCSIPEQPARAALTSSAPAGLDLCAQD